MQLHITHKDEDFMDAVVPEGYILVFYSQDENLNTIKRYKDSDGNFGTIGGSSGITDEEAIEIITPVVTQVEEEQIEVAAILVSSTAISTQLDSIIGE